MVINLHNGSEASEATCSLRQVPGYGAESHGVGHHLLAKQQLRHPGPPGSLIHRPPATAGHEVSAGVGARPAAGGNAMMPESGSPRVSLESQVLY